MRTPIDEIEPYIETLSGIKFYFLSPTPDMVDIHDIAHALSMQCRFTGHTRNFYSVAEHSVHVSNLADNALQGLMHDASEAYLTDIASPIKPHLSNYKNIEAGIMRVVAAKFGFDWPMAEDTKDADTVQLKTEARNLMRTRGKDWVNKFPTKRNHGVVPECWEPLWAEDCFLAKFKELTRVRNVA